MFSIHDEYYWLISICFRGNTVWIGRRHTGSTELIRIIELSELLTIQTNEGSTNHNDNREIDTPPRSGCPSKSLLPATVLSVTGLINSSVNQQDSAILEKGDGRWGSAVFFYLLNFFFLNFFIASFTIEREKKVAQWEKCQLLFDGFWFMSMPLSLLILDIPSLWIRMYTQLTRLSILD